MPGVEYEQKVQFTPRGPVVLNVVTATRPTAPWALRVALGGDAIGGSETLTALEGRLSPALTAVGISGDFSTAAGRPAGIAMRSGAIDHAPRPGRSSVG